MPWLVTVINLVLPVALLIDAIGVPVRRILMRRPQASRWWDSWRRFAVTGVARTIDVDAISGCFGRIAQLARALRLQGKM